MNIPTKFEEALTSDIQSENFQTFLKQKQEQEKSLQPLHDDLPKLTDEIKNFLNELTNLSEEINTIEEREKEALRTTYFKINHLQNGTNLYTNAQELKNKIANFKPRLESLQSLTPNLEANLQNLSQTVGSLSAPINQTLKTSEHLTPFIGEIIEYVKADALAELYKNVLEQAKYLKDMLNKAKKLLTKITDQLPKEII